ncbi:MAG: HK97 gp10 family phage protein [Georgenia sp.]
MSTPMVRIDAGGQVLQLRRDMLKVPPNLRKELRPSLRKVGARVQATAEKNAAWSSRIPAAMHLRVSFSHNRPGVFIQVDKTKAPHARAYEGIIIQWFRHPLFGDREYWFKQQSRPYLVPSLESNEGEAFTAIRATVDEVLSKLGL